MYVIEDPRARQGII